MGITDWSKYMDLYDPMMETRRTRATEFLLDLRHRLHQYNWATSIFWSRDGRGCLLGHVGAMLEPRRDPITLKGRTIVQLIDRDPDVKEAMEALATVCVKAHAGYRWPEDIHASKKRNGWNLSTWCSTIANFNDTRHSVKEVHIVLEETVRFLGGDPLLQHEARRIRREPLPIFVGPISDNGEYPPLTVGTKIEPDPAERVEIPKWDPDAELADLLKEKEPIAA